MKKQKMIFAGRGKMCFWLLLLAFAITGAFVLLSAEVQAATPKWKSAYSKILRKPSLVEKYDDLSYLKMYFGKGCRFNRYFTYGVDRNGIPELFLYSTEMGLTEVLTYDKKIISLGYYDIAKINKEKKEIIVAGHWHGAGGSGIYEWSIYKVGRKAAPMQYYIDDMNEVTGGSTGVVIYNGKGKFISQKRSVYNRIYRKHIKNATKYKKFKMYKLTNKKGLKR